MPKFRNLKILNNYIYAYILLFWMIIQSNMIITRECEFKNCNFSKIKKQVFSTSILVHLTPIIQQYVIKKKGLRMCIACIVKC